VETLAVVLEQPKQLKLRSVGLAPPGPDDVVVEIDWSGVSTGTERLLWSGRMPPFPGLGYPLVPGYEATGRVTEAGPRSGRTVGERVFVPGSSGFLDAHGLFGASARTVVVAGKRVIPVPRTSHVSESCLFALAATALHAVHRNGLPELVVGHGVLGRLVARLCLALGGLPPTVWEIDPTRRGGDAGYPVVDPGDDDRRDYVRALDVSGDAGILDHIIPRLGRGGSVVLAGFYADPVHFAFPAAFQREVTMLVAAEWHPDDLAAVSRMVAEGRLSLSGLITHTVSAREAPDAYRRAFEDPACLKMVLDWRDTDA
jgi:3-hydroxyethyl bacteriochlorophyllide a dehydrogenase